MEGKNRAIQEFLTHAGGQPTDICCEFYCRFLKDNQEGSQSLRYFLENYFDIHSDSSETVEPRYSKEECQSTLKKIRLIAGQLIQNLVDENLEPTEFYNRLMQVIEGDVLFTTECAKGMAVAVCLASSLVPYFQTKDAVRMSDEEYQAVGKTMSKATDEMLFILNKGYQQRTEVGSQLLRVLDGLEERTQKVVLLAQLYGYYTEKLKKSAAQKSEAEDEN